MSQEWSPGRKTPSKWIAHPFGSRTGLESPHLMTPAAVGNWDTTAAVFNGLGQIYMVTDAPTAAQTGLEPPPPNGVGGLGRAG